jgi:putative tricarboxylic transport membrane protein
LIAAVKTTTDSPAWKETLAKYGWDSAYLAGDAYATFVDEDTRRITGILESLGLRK